MVREDLTTQILIDLAPVSSLVKGVYLYGSHADGTADARSDIDICLVAGADNDPVNLQSLSWSRIRSGTYDIRIFELLPLHMQIRILARGILLMSPDPAALGEYLYPYWKRWDDQRWYQTRIPGAP